MRYLVESLPDEWREYLRTPTGIIAMLGLLVVLYGAVLATASATKDSPPPVIVPTIVVQPAPVTMIPDQREIDRRVDERLRERGVDPASGR